MYKYIVLSANVMNNYSQCIIYSNYHIKSD